MANTMYDVPTGMHPIPTHSLDLRSDAEIDQAILKPSPVTDDKNVWFYWHQGYASMHDYTKRNVRAWHRRFAKQGWTIRVLDRQPGSPHHVSNFLDTTSTALFPAAYIDGNLTGAYAVQHQSDLVRFPLLLQYGGIYADAGFLQIGNIDRLWNATIANAASPYEVLSYNAGKDDEYCLTNYFLAAKRHNTFFQRCHNLFLALWSADGGRLSTEGMHKSPLLHGVPLLGGELSFEENGHTYSAQETSEMLTDYIIQGQCLRMVMSMQDAPTNWDGPKYTVSHIFAIEYMEGSQLINEFTAWNGNEAFRLMSLHMPASGEDGSADQARARFIVEQCLLRSFGFKLATGLILRVLGETLSSLWRKHTGADNVPGTYAHWLRYAMIYFDQDTLPTPVTFKKIQPLSVAAVASLADAV